MVIVVIKNLKLLRDEKGISQEKLGEIIGVSQQSIYKYETSDVEPDISTLIEMADYFSVSVDYLIGNTIIRNKIETVDKYDLNSAESKIIDNFRKLSKAHQKSVNTIISELTNK